MPSQEWRAKNPIRAAYLQLKSNAKRRGKGFSLTLDQFKRFCVKTKYINVKGVNAESYHIDRIDETKGYSIDNIQLLTNRENVKKYFDHYYDEYNREYCFRYRKETNFNNIDAPF